jgi:hypothetical protein
MFASLTFHADNFLQRNDVRINLTQDLRDPVRSHAPIQTTALMDIVGSDTQPSWIAERLESLIHVFLTPLAKAAT